MPPDRLELAADPPVISVSATASGRRLVELPALEYRFRVQSDCGGDRTPRSLSINVADSRLALSGAALENDLAGELVLMVPARQLAPIAVDDFCVAGAAAKAGIAVDPAAPGPGDPDPAGGRPASRYLLTVPDVVSAQASLVCSSEHDSNISYVTQPLAVTLACTAPAAAGGEPGHSTGER